MPQGVCLAITSVEKDGLKNNKYIIQNTSDVPDGIIVKVDKSSWKNTTQTSGTVSFTANADGEMYKGAGELILDNGVWKINSYTLYQ